MASLVCVTWCYMEWCYLFNPSIWTESTLLPAPFPSDPRLICPLTPLLLSSSHPTPPPSSHPTPPGQFWNIPISVEPYTGVTRDGSTNVYIVTVTPPNGKQRAFPAWREDQVCAIVLKLLSLHYILLSLLTPFYLSFPCIIFLPIYSFCFSISSCSKHLPHTGNR